MNTLNKNNLSLFKIMLLLFLVNSSFIFAQNPYIKTNSGIGQYGYLEKDASTTMLLNSNTQSNIYQLYARTWLNGNNLFTYGFALNDCTASTNLDQNLNNYNFGANAIAGLIAYTSVHADYCGGSNSYSSNPNQTGYNERQHYLFDLSDRPSDVTSNVIQLNPGAITSPYNVVMSVKIDFGSVSSRILQRFWIQNTGTLAEATEIANDGFKIYYEPATGSETFNGTESNAIIYGDYNSNATNNNIYGHDALNIAIPSGGLRVYVVLNKFASCLSTAKTVQVSLINDGLSFSPAMDTSYTLARVGQTPAAPTSINVNFAAATTGALNGTYYIPSACFPTVASAVTALNSFGVSGPVIFNVLAGYTETTPSGGFNITGTGTVGNPITFQKFSTGTNPTFTAFTPQANATGSVYGDALFRIVGGDYITIDGFTMLENNSNTTTGGSNNMTEFGVGLFYATATNGTQNITVKNCTIDLDRTYTNTCGIYSNSSHTATNMTTGANASSAAGSNSNLTITGNAITDVNYGIVVIGSATATAFNDGLVIGGSLANANTITNYGTASSSATFSLRTSTVNGIVVRNTKNYTVSYNNITSSTATTVTTIRGVFVDTYSSSPTGTITNSVSNNTISVRSANTTSSGDIYGIQLDGSVGSNTSTTSINNNDFSNFGYSANSSGLVVFIYNYQVALNLNINNNTFTNNSINTSGGVAFIRNYCYVPSSGGTQNVNNNSIVTAFTKSVAGNGVWFYDSGASANSHIAGIINQSSNNFSNVTVTGATIIYGWYNYDGAGNGTSKTFQNNTFSNITGGSGAVTVMDINDGDNNVDSNTISNVSGSGTLIGINFYNHSGPKRANANIISGLSSTTTTSDVVAIWVAGGTTQTITNNVISSLTSSTNLGSFKGIYMAVPGSTSNTITGNTISGMTNSSTGTSAAVRAIHVAPATNSNPVTISSNVIYDLNGASTNIGSGISSAIIGILITASTSTSNVVNLNTLYNLNATTSSANSICVAAIATGGVSAGGTVSRNRIYGLTNTATGTNPVIAGFWPIGGTWTFANNMISLSNGVYTNGIQCKGVYDAGLSNTRNYYYNSIHIAGSSVGTQYSVALQFNSASGTANIYNNILNMTRTGSGKNYALANLTSGLANMNCNYNILNAANSATVVATNGITDNSFTTWQATGKDANSITEAIVFFTDVTIADLHIPTATCTSGDGAATPLAITTDYDNDARDATAPDIGADEFSTYDSIWDGTAWSTWNGVSFSSAIPTGNTNLIFMGNYSSPASLEGCACTVTSGNVQFNSSHTLTLLKKLTVAAAPTATMTFENNSSLVQTNSAVTVTNTGNITYKRTTTPYERYDYVYWSTPVADTRTLSTIFSGWRSDYSFTFNTQNFADLLTAATGLPPSDSFDDNGDAWVYAGPSATMTNGKGYAVMAPTSVTFSPQALPTTVSFLGVANNGVIPFRIYESANAASTTDDFNLIGNPYPSAIWADKFITDNGVKTSGTLYFWTHVADVSVSNPGPSVSNFVTADYALYNLTGGTRASLTGSSVPTGKVASGQGFFIEAQANNVDVVFNNSMRDKTYLNNDFFKTSNTTSEIEKDRLWLNLQNPDGLFSQLLIGYFAQTTLGFDWAYDGRVNTSNTQLAFYSLAENEKYKIQARPTFSDTDKVPLGYFSIANGQFTINLEQREGVFDTDQNIYLEDRDMNIIHDLKQSPYTFTTTYGRFENRFILRYTNEALGTPDFETLDSSVVVATNHGEMNIKSLLENIQDVTVYDILGRQLFETKSIGKKDFSASNITMSQQTLIVKIKLENGIVSRKIIL